MANNNTKRSTGVTVQDLQNLPQAANASVVEDREAIAARAQSLTAPATAKPQATINSEVLGNPKAALKLPPVVPSTLAEGTQEYIASQNNSIKSERERQLDLDREALKGDRQDIFSLIEDLGRSGEMKEQLYKEQGVDKAKLEVDDYTSQIEAEQLSNRRRVEALRKNPQGLFAGGVEQEINRISNESISKQADLAILQNASLRKYSTASEIADRQLQAKLEPMKAKLEGLKFFYEENKADFNKEDDRLYSEMITAQDREYEAVKAKETANNQALKEAIGLGAPADVIKNIQNLIASGASEAEVAAAAGKYSVIGRGVLESDRTYNLQKAQADKKSYQFTEDPNGNPVIFDPETGNISNVDLSAIATKFGDGQYGGQCGDFVKNLVTLPFAQWGDPLQSKLDRVREYGISADQWRNEGARPGDTIVTNDHPTYGHVAVVLKDNGDGTVTVKDSNFSNNNDEKIRTRIVDMAGNNIKGVIRGELKAGLLSTQSAINITKDQRQRLQTEGMSQEAINTVLMDVSTVGIDEALGGDSGLSDAQKNAFTEVLRGKTAVDNNQFLSKDYFKNLFTSDQLRKSAAEAGFKRGGSFWKNDDGVGEEGIDDYLGYLEGLVQQYRAAGFTDKEILEKMK